MTVCSVVPVHLRKSYCNREALIRLTIDSSTYDACLPCAAREITWAKLATRKNIHASSAVPEVAVLLNDFSNELLAKFDDSAELNYVEDLVPFVEQQFWAEYRQRLTEATVCAASK